MLEQLIEDKIPSLNGQDKRLLIDGIWVDACNRKKFESEKAADMILNEETGI